MRNFKKILSLILTVLIVTSVSIMSLTVNAADNISPSLIDADKTGSITIHKYEMENTDEATELGTGETSDAAKVPDDAKPLEGVTYRITRVANLVNSDGTLDTTYYSSNGIDLPSVAEAKSMNAVSTPLHKTTGSDGIASFTSLPLGIYLVEEISAPSHVITNLEDQAFVVSVPSTNADSTAWNYDIHTYPKNQTLYSDLVIKKTDYTTGKVLSGAVFDLYSSTEKNGEYNLVESDLQTSEDGIASVSTDLPVNMYYQIKETKAPDGYILDTASENTVTTIYINKNGVICDSSQNPLGYSQTGENIVTISGTSEDEKLDISGEDIVIKNKNLFEYNPTKAENGAIRNISCDCTVENNSYKITTTGTDCYIGEIVAEGNKYDTSRGTLFTYTPNVKISTLESDVSITKCFVTFYDADKASLGYSYFYAKADVDTLISNKGLNADDIKYFSLRMGTDKLDEGTTFTLKCQVEIGDTYTDYVTPQSNTENRAYGEVTNVIGSGPITVTQTSPQVVITNSKPLISKAVSDDATLQTMPDTTSLTSDIDDNVYFYISVTTPNFTSSDNSSGSDAHFQTFEITDKIPYTFEYQSSKTEAYYNGGTKLSENDYSINVDSNNNLTIKINKNFAPNTEYVFRIASKLKSIDTSTLGCPIVNTASLTYSTSTSLTSTVPTSTITSNEAETHTSGYQFKKVDGNNSPLEGATFQIYASSDDAENGTNPLYFKNGDGELSTVATSDDNGLVTFHGLSYGSLNAQADEEGSSTEYWIVETSTLDGYNLIAEPIEVTVDKYSWDYNNTQAIVTNSSKLLLPYTGGTGFLIFTVAGLMFVLIGGGLMLYFKKKKKTS